MPPELGKAPLEPSSPPPPAGLRVTSPPETVAGAGLLPAGDPRKGVVAHAGEAAPAQHVSTLGAVAVAGVVGRRPQVQVGGVAARGVVAARPVQDPPPGRDGAVDRGPGVAVGAVLAPQPPPVPAFGDGPDAVTVGLAVPDPLPAPLVRVALDVGPEAGGAREGGRGTRDLSGTVRRFAAIPGRLVSAGCGLDEARNETGGLAADGRGRAVLAEPVGAIRGDTERSGPLVRRENYRAVPALHCAGYRVPR